MTLLNVDQRFHGVGQGLFYSASLSVLTNGSNQTFSFVYDCGSESRHVSLTREISHYKKLHLCSGSLDLLVLSHLHQDHVNGLDQLLNGITTKCVVLPYLDPVERLFLSVSQDAARAYADFLFNPTVYLMGLGVKKIYYVTRGEGGPVESPQNESQPPILDGQEFSPHFDQMSEDEQTLEKAQKEDNVSGDGVFFIRDSKAVPVSPLWQFFFYVAKADPQKLRIFEACVSQTLGQLPLIDALKDPASRKRLKDCYKRVSTDLNTTSLSCLHGPLSQRPIVYDSLVLPGCCWPVAFLSQYPHSAQAQLFQDWQHWMEHRCGCHPLLNHCQHAAQSYTHLLGDMNANVEWNNIKNRYQALFSLIRLFQVPHHGSDLSWNANICSALTPHRYIIPAGLSNRYGHPGAVVLQDIQRTVSPMAIEWVNEHHSFLSRMQCLLN